MEAVTRCGCMLSDVPAQLMVEHPKMTLTAGSQDGLSLQYVPQSLRTSELVRTAVSQNGLALNYVLAAEREAYAGFSGGKHVRVLKLVFRSGRRRCDAF